MRVHTVPSPVEVFPILFDVAERDSGYTLMKFDDAAMTSTCTYSNDLNTYSIDPKTFLAIPGLTCILSTTCNAPTNSHMDRNS